VVEGEQLVELLAQHPIRTVELATLLIVG